VPQLAGLSSGQGKQRHWQKNGHRQGKQGDAAERGQERKQASLHSTLYRRLTGTLYRRLTGSLDRTCNGAPYRSLTAVLTGRATELLTGGLTGSLRRADNGPRHGPGWEKRGEEKERRDLPSAGILEERRWGGRGGVRVVSRRREWVCENH